MHDFEFPSREVFEPLPALAEEEGDARDEYESNSNLEAGNGTGERAAVRSTQTIVEAKDGLGSLRGCNLRDLNDVVISSDVVHLDLSHNSLSFPLDELPSFLFSLSLSSNSLQTLEGISDLNALRELDLSHNRISTLLDSQGRPLLMVCRHLEILSLAHNALDSPAGLEPLKDLALCDLSHNAVGSEEALHYLSPLRRLQSISLEGNPLANSPRYRALIRQYLPSLAVLDSIPVVSRAKAVSRAAPSTEKRESGYSAKGDNRASKGRRHPDSGGHPAVRHSEHVAAARQRPKPKPSIPVKPPWRPSSATVKAPPPSSGEARRRGGEPTGAVKLRGTKAVLGEEVSRLYAYHVAETKMMAHQQLQIGDVVEDLRQTREQVEELRRGVGVLSPPERSSSDCGSTAASHAREDDVQRWQQRYISTFQELALTRAALADVVKLSTAKTTEASSHLEKALLSALKEAGILGDKGLDNKRKTSEALLLASTIDGKMELGRPSLRALLDYWEQRDSMKQTEQKSPPQTEYREEPQDADMSPSSPRSPSLMSHGNGETSLSPLAAVEDFGAEVSDRLETVTSALSIICDQESVELTEETKEQYLLIIEEAQLLVVPEASSLVRSTLQWARQDDDVDQSDSNSNESQLRAKIIHVEKQWIQLLCLVECLQGIVEALTVGSRKKGMTKVEFKSQTQDPRGDQRVELEEVLNRARQFLADYVI